MMWLFLKCSIHYSSQFCYSSVRPVLESSYAGGGMKSEYYRWPKAIIPYQISSSFSVTNYIYSAMKVSDSSPFLSSVFQLDSELLDVPESTMIHSLARLGGSERAVRANPCIDE